MFQHQCPNCGSYKTQYEWTDRATRIRNSSNLTFLYIEGLVTPGLRTKMSGVVRGNRTLRLWRNLAFFGGIAALLFGATYLIIDKHPSSVLSVSPFLLAFALALTALGINLRIKGRRNRVLAEVNAEAKAKAEATIPSGESLYDFSCELCGYKWTWKGSGNPPTTFGTPANPDAARLGAVRLAELEEQKRRAAAAAAAAAAAYAQQKRDGLR